MTVTRVSRTKRSSDCAVGTLEFEFKEDSRNSRVSDWLRKICFRDGHLVISSDLLLSNTDLSVVNTQASETLLRKALPLQSVSCWETLYFDWWQVRVA